MVAAAMVPADLLLLRPSAEAGDILALLLLSCAAIGGWAALSRRRARKRAPLARRRSMG